MTRVIFFQIQTPQEKVARLTEKAQAHFENKEHFLIFTEDATTEHFVDELLWKYPKTSFLPHICAEEPVPDPLIITRGKKNLNEAKVAFNLCPTPLLIESPFRIIYEFEDLTSPSKKNFSSLRFQAYKQAGFLIEAQ